MNVLYHVELSQAERSELTTILSKGKRAARKLKRAQILLAADAGSSDEEIARAVAVGGSTVYRTKRRFVEGNLERALSEDPGRAWRAFLANGSIAATGRAAPGRRPPHNLVSYGISDVPMTSEEWQAQYCAEEIKGEFLH